MVIKYGFSELPEICKKSLFVMCDWAEKVEDISDFYKNKNFEIEEISVSEAKRRCFKINNYGFSSFDDYHEDYIKAGDVIDHKESVYPVIESSDIRDEEWLFDGWHRFHSYVKHYPNRKIPVLKIL